MKFLFIGDIVGRAGRKSLNKLLKPIRKKYNIDIVIANVENSANGYGVTEKVYLELSKYGVDIFTGGNHIWDQKEIFNKIDKFEYLVRPANYPAGTPGKFVYKDTNLKFAVINLLGRVFMQQTDCPFRKFDEIYNDIKDYFVIVDFHGEATSEKVAFANYVDGRANVVIGTHTHIQTNDDRILPEGTLYLTDVGMCGAVNSVIGMKKELSIKKFLTGLPVKLEVEKKGEIMFNALFFEFDQLENKVTSFEKINLCVED
jgi:metallophosphoesterase (TIGR00282 family)